MNKLTRAILVGICTALFAVFVLLAPILFEWPFLDSLAFGAGFLVIVLDPRLHTFYRYGNGFGIIAVSAIGWFLVGAMIGFFFEKMRYIIGAWIVAYIIACIISFILLLRQAIPLF